MKRLMTATAALALTAGSAMAATTLDDLDMTGDEFASVEEVKAAFTEFPIEQFEQLDLNGDNRLSANEVQELEAQETFGQYDLIPVEERELIVVDADSNGFIEEDEMRRVFPEFTSVDYDLIDQNDDNRVTYQEYYANEATPIIAKYRVEDSIMDIADIDTDNDDFADFDEMVAAFPGLSEIDFDDIDDNDDNRISAQELYAPEAQEIVSRADS